jgi:hypothetical protein
MRPALSSFSRDAEEQAGTAGLRTQCVSLCVPSAATPQKQAGTAGLPYAMRPALPSSQKRVNRVNRDGFAYRLKKPRDPFLHNHHSLTHLMAVDRGAQPVQRFVRRLKAQSERPVMHRNHDPCIQLRKSLDGLLRIHMDFSAGRWVVGPDR